MFGLIYNIKDPNPNIKKKPLIEWLFTESFWEQLTPRPERLPLPAFRSHDCVIT